MPHHTFSIIQRLSAGGSHGSPPLLQAAFGAAAAAALSLSLSPGSAQAACDPASPANTCRVTVGGLQYDVTTFTGTYNDNASKFSSTLMPWYGSSSIANQFAATVGGGLLYPNGGNGPFFAWSQSSGNISIFYTYEGNPAYPSSGFPYGQYSNATIPTGANYVWAQVEAVASVPGPLPIFGAGAAFGFSRKLRKRIQESRVSAGSSQPLA